MPSIAQLKKMLASGTINKWVSPNSVVGFDTQKVQNCNYDHGRLQGTPEICDYLEEFGERSIVNYIEDLVRYRPDCVDNLRLQEARVWLILNYWSVAATYPNTAWLPVLTRAEFSSVMRMLISARQNVNPFVDDLICAFTRELVLALDESRLNELIVDLPSDVFDYLRYIKCEFQQDGFRFSELPFGEMKLLG